MIQLPPTFFPCRRPPPLSVDVAKRRPQPHYGLLERRQQARLPGGPGSSRESARTSAKAEADQFTGNGGAEPAVDVTLAHFYLPLALQGLIKFDVLSCMRQGDEQGKGHGRQG